MGIALFSAATLIESLQGVIDWLAPREQRPAANQNTPPEVWHRPTRLRGRSGHPGQTSGASKHGTEHASAPLLPCSTARRQLGQVGQVARNVRAQRPLRVVRVMDMPATSAASAFAGRMVISGRMADVCAELDRLAALEASSPALMPSA